MKTLFDTTTLGGIALKNRLIRSATYEAMADERGGVTQRLLDLYTRLAEGDIGLIITGSTAVLPDGRALPSMLALDSDELIDGSSQLTATVHERGGKIVQQLGYCGNLGFIRIENTYSPSAVPAMAGGHPGIEMSAADIRRLTDGFAAAAARSKAAGFDGVQIHSSAGFLLSQFLTPCCNRRSDPYGGPIENRMRLLTEVYEAIRRAVGPGFAILLKINCADFIDGGLTAEESLAVCREMAFRGIDAIEITGGVHAVREKTSVRTGILTPDQEAYFGDYSARVAANVTAPIIMVGGLRSPEVMERVLSETDIAYFSLCRPLVAEPDLIKRWSGGDRNKASCVSCNRCLSPEGVACRRLVA